MPSKQKVKKQTPVKNKIHHTRKTTDDEEQPTSISTVFHGLPREEIDFLRNRVSFSFEPNLPGKGSASSRKEYEKKFVSTAAFALQQFHMCILHAALTPEDIAVITEEYGAMLDVKHGAHAIGEKDSSKRSGTRMWNCPCQLGPNCGFKGWREGSEHTRLALQAGGSVGANTIPIWQSVCNVFGFTHVARVEVVTSHVGCRNQDWHCDSAHGLTVIFALVDIDLAKGPTEIEFMTPFNGLGHDNNSGSKIKQKDSLSPESVHACLPQGSVLIFNANANHRGTANLSKSDRPILVLDTSPCCEHLEGTCWDSV